MTSLPFPFEAKTRPGESRFRTELPYLFLVHELRGFYSQYKNDSGFLTQNISSLWKYFYLFPD